MGDEMKKKKRLKKRKISRVNFISSIIIVFIVFFVMLVGGFCFFIYVNAPEFNTDLLYKQESSNLYDSNGKLIVTIGEEKRQLVELIQSLFMKLHIKIQVKYLTMETNYRV